MFYSVISFVGSQFICLNSLALMFCLDLSYKQKWIQFLNNLFFFLFSGYVKGTEKDTYNQNVVGLKSFTVPYALLHSETHFAYIRTVL